MQSRTKEEQSIFAVGVHPLAGLKARASSRHESNEISSANELVDGLVRRGGMGTYVAPTYHTDEPPHFTIEVRPRL